MSVIIFTKNKEKNAFGESLIRDQALEDFRYGNNEEHQAVVCHESGYRCVYGDRMDNMAMHQMWLPTSETSTV